MADENGNMNFLGAIPRNLRAAPLPAVVALPPPHIRDPFAALPETKLDYNNLKLHLKNKDEFFEFYSENFGIENNSIWRCEFKDNAKLEAVFEVDDMICDWFHRIGAMRSVSIASMCAFGEDNNISLSGIWLWRGKDFTIELSPAINAHGDYKWEKLDPEAELTKKLIKDYFFEPPASKSFSDREGRYLQHRKIFK